MGERIFHLNEEDQDVSKRSNQRFNFLNEMLSYFKINRFDYDT